MNPSFFDSQPHGLFEVIEQWARDNPRQKPCGIDTGFGGDVEMANATRSTSLPEGVAKSTRLKNSAREYQKTAHKEGLGGPINHRIMSWRSVTGFRWQ